jgi:predicted nucleotidyltransferase
VSLLFVRWTVLDGQERRWVMVEVERALAVHSATILADVVLALQNGLGDRLTGVVLFGSRARGDAEESSDWDLLVVARDLPVKPLQRHMWLKHLLPVSWRGQVAILAKTPDEFTSRLPGLYLDIALDGLVLYDRDGFMTTRLARLRQAIAARGLYRESAQREMTWRWQHFPGFDWSLEWEAV